MIKISQDEIEHLVALARIEFGKAEKEQLMQELGSILDYVAECEEAPTDSPTGAIRPIEQIAELKNISRADEIKPSLSVEKVLQNAPESASWRKGNFIKTRKVFE